MIKERLTEGSLTLLSFFTTSLLFYAAAGAAGKISDIEIILTPVIIFAAFLITGQLIRFFISTPNPYLLPLVHMLAMTGLSMIFRLNLKLARLQFNWILIGLLALIITSLTIRKYKILFNYKYIFGLLAFIFIFSTAFFGVEVNGARLWIKIAGLSFQPSEIGKIFMVIFLAGYLSERSDILSLGTRKVLGIRLAGLRHIGPLISMWGLSVTLLIFEKDLGASLLFFTIFLIMLYASSGRPAYIIIGLMLFILGSYLCYLIFPHIQNRIAIWFSPWNYYSSSGYQVAQGLISLAAGGITGRGIGLGMPTIVPVNFSDFIFAAFGEEIGLLGLTGLLGIYLTLIFFIFRTAVSCNDRFGKLLCTGIGAIISMQCFIIIGGVTKLIPLTGITLPFLSYGGSSMLSNLIAIALVLSISQRQKVTVE
ncbi:MAG: FtsW/RodA/SpoVE family cell cycle protein [Actinobacteria bacterium]|nr:FtsW/RodA/SpoVE family cell cycle protein [Actinomycetota bacterium]